MMDKVQKPCNAKCNMPSSEPFRINDIFRLVTFLYFSMGETVIELYWKHAPMTCRNFAELVRRNYYNGTKFHRIIRDFMIQGKLTKFEGNLIK
jgi:hypothetical protein